MRVPTDPAGPLGRGIRPGRWLGVDLGGTNLKLIVLDVSSEGDVTTTCSGQRATEAERGPASVVSTMIAAGRELRAAYGPFDGVGLGVPGLFDSETGTIEFLPNLPGAWAGVPVVDEIGRGIGSPASIINDARAFTFAEATLGAAARCSTVAGYVLGTGVGGGLVVEGRLLLGPDGRAGELGHCVVDSNGPRCGCGAFGCLEVFAAAPRIAALAAQPTAEAAFVAAAAGDPTATAAVALVCDRFARAIVDIVNVLRPDRVVVGGGVAAAGDALFVPLRAAVETKLTLVDPSSFDIVPAVLGPWAGVTGAALWAAYR